ncbi:MAG: aspartate aminotransferase family protein [Anaerolineae bacterium]|nr:aspartate aminotransferase family protein [Anaerolineae bacterium]
MISRTKSNALLERARNDLPGGVGSDIRLAEKPFPIFFDHARGSHMWDVDGNEYIDYMLAMGPLILGHTPAPVIEAVKQQLDRGLIYGGQHELEVQVAEKIRQHVPCAEMVRFNNTGSEAVHAALRLARGYTGRQKIVKFEGHYHGWLDSALISSGPSLGQAGPPLAPNAVLESGGQAKSVLDDVIVLPWNNLELLAATLREHGDEIAGIITEPIMCNSGDIMPRSGYLEGMRRLCTEFGVVLIFDEVITGFRYGLGGAQGLFGVVPDLAVFAKAVAAGFPLSCVAGKRTIMELIAQRRVMHAGTYNTGAVVMAAALATLKELERNDGAVYRHLWAIGEKLSNGIRALLQECRIPALVNNTGPSFYVALTDCQTFYDYRDTLKRDDATYQRLAAALADRGVRIKSNGLWFLSAAHTDLDVDVTLEALRSAISDVMG